MLFFRSEEEAGRWCAAQHVPKRRVATLLQLWQLSVMWYGNRLTPRPPRFSPDEMRSIFADIGLDPVFWDPESTQFD